MPLASGTLLNDRYRIERILGQGGMGAVYLAHDDNLGVECAVKENLNVSPESERQFKREANLLASLRHPNLPRVTNHFVLGGQQYLVMDYIEGEDLKERLLRDHPLKEADVVRWAAQICEALTYLHGLNPPVVHRDIKPGNIKLNAQGEAILVDFGIAKATATGSKTTAAASAFTPGYAPPEQYGMGRTDPRTDQFALASTLYALLTGQTPPDSMERLLGNLDLTPPEAYRPDLSRPVCAAIVRGMALKPDDRFPTVADFKAALLGRAPAGTTPAATVMAGAASTPAPTIKVAGTQPTPAVPTTAAPRLPSWVWWVGGAGTVLLVGVGTFLLALALGTPAATPPPATLTPTLAPASATVPAASLATATAPLPSETPAPSAPTATVPPPVILQADLSANAISAGDGVTLSWAFANVTEVRIAGVEGVFAPTGQVILTPTESLTYTLTGLNADTGASVVVVRALTVNLRPQGEQLPGRIAFISNRDGQHYQIYTMKPDGSDVRQLTFDPRDKWSPDWKLGRLQQPVSGPLLAWSPDGSQLLYSANAGVGTGVDLWVVNADGTNPVNLTATTRPDEKGDNYQPVWCASGDIAYTSTRINDTPQIFMMRLEGDRRRRNFSTTRSNPLEFDPVFFPTCQRMFVVTTQNGVPEIWRIFPFRETLSGLWQTFPALAQQSYRTYHSEKTSLNAWVYDPAISPDGRYLAFTREAPDPEGQRIVIVEITESGGQTLQPATLTGSLPPRPRNRDYSASFSPDGRYLVFVSERDGNREIYRMSLTGVDQVNLSNNGANDVSPVWYLPPTP